MKSSPLISHEMGTEIASLGNFICRKRNMMRIAITLVTLLLTFPLLSQKLEVEGDVDVKNNTIQNVADPMDPQDAATKAYVDQMSEILLNAGINGVVEDIDGNFYKTIKIGSQVWMAENLKTTHYNDGMALPNVTDNIAWINLTTPAYCWYNNDSTMNATVLGALYNYYVVADTNSHNVCPAGWHVPSDTEWTILADFLTTNGYGYEGSGIDIAKSMAATFRWNTGVTPGNVGNDPGSNNISGFSGLPAGGRSPILGMFTGAGSDGSWWSSSESGPGSAWFRALSHSLDLFIRGENDPFSGSSVRCVRD